MNAHSGLLLPRDVGRLTNRKPNKNGAKGRLSRNHAMREAMRAIAEIDDGTTEGALVIIELLRETLQTENQKAPQWRDLNKANLLFMLHTGLKLLGDEQPDLNMVTTPFSFNLTPELVKEASRTDERSFSSYILKRLRAALKRELDRDVDLFFVVEIAKPGPAGRPHLHGEILLTGREAEREAKNVNHPERRPIHQAFHSVNGEYDNKDFKSSAIRFEMDRCDLGWADYIAKHLNISSMYYDGKTIAKTEGCTRSARQLYDVILIGKRKPTTE